MKVYNFEKQGIKFSFRNPLWNDFYKELTMEYKVLGIKESKENDGYFYNSSFMPSKNAMSLNNIKINNKNIAGVGLPENILAEVTAMYEQMRKETLQKKLNSNIKYTLNDTTSYGIYNGISQFDITEIVTDIKKQYNTDIFLFAEDIAKILNKDEELKQLAEQSYHSDPEGNWNEEYLTWFRTAAQEKKAPGYGIIPNQIIKQKITEIILSAIQDKTEQEQQENERIYNLFKLAKQTNKPQVIEKWMERCNDPREECNTDLIVVYAMPDGSKKVERTHTW